VHSDFHSVDVVLILIVLGPPAFSSKMAGWRLPCRRAFPSKRFPGCLSCIAAGEV
jgi:hypothetical protein